MSYIDCLMKVFIPIIESAETFTRRHSSSALTLAFVKILLIEEIYSTSINAVANAMLVPTFHMGEADAIETQKINALPSLLFP